MNTAALWKHKAKSNQCLCIFSETCICPEKGKQKMRSHWVSCTLYHVPHGLERLTAAFNCRSRLDLKHRQVSNPEKSGYFTWKHHPSYDFLFSVFKMSMAQLVPLVLCSVGDVLCHGSRSELFISRKFKLCIGSSDVWGRRRCASSFWDGGEKFTISRLGLWCGCVWCWELQN